MPESSSGPDAAADWLAEADRCRRAGQLTDAYRAYYRAARSAARATAAAGYLGLAELAMQRRRAAPALRDARRAIDLGADPRRAWQLIARAAVALGDAGST
jgi:tetratricopeptide (TPR) repeat protein